MGSERSENELVVNHFMHSACVSGFVLVFNSRSYHFEMRCQIPLMDLKMASLDLIPTDLNWVPHVNWLLYIDVASYVVMVEMALVVHDKCKTTMNPYIIASP